MGLDTPRSVMKDRPHSEPGLHLVPALLDPQDALGHALELLAIELIDPAEVVDRLGDGAVAYRIPDVLGELVMAGS